MPRPKWLDTPPDAQHDWINAKEAAQLLGLGWRRVLDLAKAEKLPATRQGTRGPLWFRRDEINTIASIRELRDQWKKRHTRSGTAPHIETIEWEIAERTFLPTNLAAERLGVTKDTLLAMVRRGRIFCYRTKGGQRPGTKFWFSPTAIDLLKNDETRLKRRKNYQKGHANSTQRIPRNYFPEEDLNAPAYICLLKAGKEQQLVTTRQAASRLGISVHRLLDIRRCGHLRGEQIMLHGKTLRYWYFFPDEIEELLNHPHHQLRRSRQIKGTKQQNKGDSKPAFTPNYDHLNPVETDRFDPGPHWADNHLDPFSG